MTTHISEQLESIARLNRDLAQAAQTLGPDEARFLVDAYYTMQKNRIRANNQIAALSQSEEPHAVLAYYKTQSEALENQIKRALDHYSRSQTVGQWSRSIIGVGPVIAAGLMAHIDIRRAPTAGHIWSFAGLDPNAVWAKGQKRPWNAQLKTLCWKLGESFTKVSGNDESFYGRIYKDRKALETERNEAGLFADQAQNKLETTKIGKDTDAYAWYSAGKLPPARLQLRAQRYAVKLFLAHWHEIAYKAEYDVPPPNPYPIAHLGHAHKIEPPT